MSGQPDGGRLAGRVLAYLYNPDWKKKVPEKAQKVTESLRAKRLSRYRVWETLRRKARAVGSSLRQGAAWRKEPQGWRPELPGWENGDGCQRLCRAHLT